VILPTAGAPYEMRKVTIRDPLGDALPGDASSSSRGTTHKPTNSSVGDYTDDVYRRGSSYEEGATTPATTTNSGGDAGDRERAGEAFDPYEVSTNDTRAGRTKFPPEKAGMEHRRSRSGNAPTKKLTVRLSSFNPLKMRIPSLNTLNEVQMSPQTRASRIRPGPILKTGPGREDDARRERISKFKFVSTTSPSAPSATSSTNHEEPSIAGTEYTHNSAQNPEDIEVGIAEERKNAILQKNYRKETLLFSQMEYYSYTICLVGLSDVILSGIAVVVSSNDDNQCYLSNSAVSFLCGLLVLIQGFTVCIALNWYVIVGDYRKPHQRRKSKKKDRASPYDAEKKNKEKFIRQSSVSSIGSQERQSPYLSEEGRSVSAHDEDRPMEYLSFPSSPAKDSNPPTPTMAGMGMAAFLRQESMNSDTHVHQSPPFPFPTALTVPGKSPLLRAVSSNPNLTPESHPHTPNPFPASQYQFVSSYSLPSPQLSMTTIEEKAQRSRVVGRLLIGSLLLMLMVSVGSLVNFLTRQKTTSEDVDGCGDKYFSNKRRSNRDNWNAFSFTVVTDLATLVLGGLAILWAFITFCRVRLLKSSETQALAEQHQLGLNKDGGSFFGDGDTTPMGSPTAADAVLHVGRNTPFATPSSFAASPGTTNQTSAPQTLDARGHLKPFDEELPIPGLASLLSQSSLLMAGSTPIEDQEGLACPSPPMSPNDHTTESDDVDDDQSQFDFVIKDPRGSQCVQREDSDYVASVNDPLIAHIYEEALDIRIEGEMDDDRESKCGSACLPNVCGHKKTNKTGMNTMIHHTSSHSSFAPL